MKIETTTYKELSEWFERWGLGCSNFIVLESEGGLGKTSIMFETLKGQKFHYFNTHVTPVAMYIQLVNRPELPIVFDDVDGLTDEPVKVALMKQLCETRVRKKVQWTSTTKLLEDYPQSFETSAPVLVLTNRMKNRDPAIGALLDRGDHLYFKPTLDEVLAYIKRILAKLEFHKPVTLKEKQMVFKYFDKQVRANKSIISVRTFMHCIEDYLYDKTKRRDWKKSVIKRIARNKDEDKILQALRVVQEERLLGLKAASRFAAMTKLKKSSFYIYREKYGAQI